MKKNRITIWIVLGIAILAGGLYLALSGGDLVKEQEDGVLAEIDEASIAESPAETAIREEEPTPEIDVESTNEPIIPPTPRTGMVSTDPSTVNLASGDIQLIEIFAFW